MFGIDINWSSFAIGLVAALVVVLVIWLIYTYAWKDTFDVKSLPSSSDISASGNQFASQFSSPQDRAHWQSAVAFAAAATSDAKAGNNPGAIQKMAAAMDAISEIDPTQLTNIVGCHNPQALATMRAQQAQYAPTINASVAAAPSLLKLNNWWGKVVNSAPSCAGA